MWGLGYGWLFGYDEDPRAGKCAHPSELPTTPGLDTLVGSGHFVGLLFKIFSRGILQVLSDLCVPLSSRFPASWYARCHSGGPVGSPPPTHSFVGESTPEETSEGVYSFLRRKGVPVCLVTTSAGQKVFVSRLSSLLVSRPYSLPVPSVPVLVPVP